MKIVELTSIQGVEEQLVRLFVGCIDDGASLGFLKPAEAGEILSYWHGVEQDLKANQRRLFVAMDRGEIVGTVQLALSVKANGAHRGEVQKLMVAKSSQGQGYSKQLMMALEVQAKALALSLLVLDSRLGDIASLLYKKLGFSQAGIIPDYVLNSDGLLEATVVFYKQI
ncbi:GNAT family N-acetyltransferase [Marinifaba aquimaris]|uniref:GNAT family N-acetyltransferase n=1 Tax=Marinifaba aquimaris TaxID=2741323 RepID=UPI001FE99D16|nr:GNAT family N-acetyltransferase [Marinifaba aquimaris]